MANLEENLNQLLSDPNAMEQIFSLAGKLGLSGNAPTEADIPEHTSEKISEDAEPPHATSLPPLFGPESLGQMGKLLELFPGTQQSKQEADALLDALRPFLRRERQEKLDRARRLAGLSQTARQAYRLWKEGELHV